MPVVPAATQTIRRYAAVCNNPVTLRGHLAARKLFHNVLGLPWAGQNDAYVRAAAAGLVRLQPSQTPRMAIRKELSLKIVAHCLASDSPDMTTFGIFAALAYLYALRVPSELLRQWSAQLLHPIANVWVYGPIRRKNCTGVISLRQACLCKTQYRLMCPHSWVGRVPTAAAQWTVQRFNDTLRQVLRTIGLPLNDVVRYSSHDFRRGCAKDILQQAGPLAMMGHCGWAAHRSALHYVSRDEVDQSIVATMMADNSDEDD